MTLNCSHLTQILDENHKDICLFRAMLEELQDRNKISTFIQNVL